MNTRRYIAMILALIVMAACSSTVETTTTAARPSTTTSTTVPEDPLAVQLEWVMGMLNGAEVSAQDYEEHFEGDFRKEVPYDETFLPGIVQLQAAGPYQILEENRISNQAMTATIEAGDATRLLLKLGMNNGGLINVLVTERAELPPLENPPESLEQAASQLSEVGETSMLAATVASGKCSPIFASEAERPVPLGSVFNLYVLGAVADAVAAGSITWTDELVITDELKSVPRGLLQNQPDGSTTTVREAAELMIAISDNTATDLLINLVGREQVEQAQVAYGNSAPELNMPFLTTREWAVLKLGEGAGTRRADYLAADESGKRQILEDIAGVRATSLAADDWNNPIAPDQLEWFASLADICIAHARLQAKAKESGLQPVAEILSISSGIPTDKWDYIAYKGGSEPGLLTTSWLMRAANGSTYFFGASVLSTSKVFEDEIQVVLRMAAARDLIGE